MKLKFVLLCLIVGLFAACCNGASKAGFPQPVGLVNDFAGVLRLETNQQLSGILTELQQKTGAQVVLVTVKTVAPYDVQEYANDLFRHWQIGQKGKDNGLLILAVLEGNKGWIEVGYGLEGIITDGTAGEIRDKYIRPAIKVGDYSQGLYLSAVAFASIIAEDAQVTLTGIPQVRDYRSDQQQASPIGNLIFIVVLIGLFFILGPSRFFNLLFFLFLMGGMGGGSRYGSSRGGGFGDFGGGFGGFGGGSSGGGGAGW